MKVKNFFLKQYFKNKIRNSKYKVGVCFGGGGARGFAHLGAIKAFEEYGINFDVVAGCSVGAMIGAFYCAGFSYEQMYEIASKLKTKDIKSNKFYILPSKNQGLIDLVQNNITCKDISGLKKRFYPVAVDLISGKEVVFSSGDIAQIVTASCCVPGVFEPVRYNDMVLVDGGVLNTLPADVPKIKGCDYVVSIDVNSARGSGGEGQKMLDIIKTSFRLMIKNNCVKGYLNSDLIIKPDTKRFKSTKAKGMDEMIEEGYVATVKAIPKIIELMHGRGKKKPVFTDFYDD